LIYPVVKIKGLENLSLGQKLKSFAPLQRIWAGVGWRSFVVLEFWEARPGKNNCRMKFYNFVIILTVNCFCLMKCYCPFAIPPCHTPLKNEIRKKHTIKSNSQILSSQLYLKCIKHLKSSLLSRVISPVRENKVDF